MSKKESDSDTEVKVLTPSREELKNWKERRRHIDERLQSLYRRTQALEEQVQEIEADRFYRVCIFGSARIKPESEEYGEVFELARLLATDDIDILTGGGPGLMEAANKGAKEGRGNKKSGSLSFGLSIELEWEPHPNPHLDVKRHHHKFSSRLDDFMRLSHSVICTPGGIGTLLELYFTWQLVQVKHIKERPIVLMDASYWTGVIDWMKDVPLARGLVSEKDFNCISIVDSPREAYDIIASHHSEFRKHRRPQVIS